MRGFRRGTAAAVAKRENLSKNGKEERRRGGRENRGIVGFNGGPEEFISPKVNLTFDFDPDREIFRTNIKGPRSFHLGQDCAGF